MCDAPLGTKPPCATILTPEEEARMGAFRTHPPLPLDACLYVLQVTLPHLTRSARHRGLQSHGIRRLPDLVGDTPAQKRFKPNLRDYFHIDIAEVRTEGGEFYLFGAIDRVCKFAWAELYKEAHTMGAAQFLRGLIAAVLYKIHAVLTDHGIQFTYRTRD
jgi:hypothetical protein